MQGYIKKILGSGHNCPSSSASHNTTLIISNDGMKGIIKIVKSVEDSGLLLKGGTKTVKNEAKEQKGGFLSMLLGALGASLLGNILTEREINTAGEGVVRAGYGRHSSKNKKLDS